MVLLPGRWVLDADIRGFFDNMSHEWTMKFMSIVWPNRRILRLIQKWLKAGVSEDSQWSETKLGTPQGAVVSPLIANVLMTDENAQMRTIVLPLLICALEI
jgi:RNA-directed DNA polymerase